MEYLRITMRASVQTTVIKLKIRATIKFLALVWLLAMQMACADSADDKTHTNTRTDSRIDARMKFPTPLADFDLYRENLRIYLLANRMRSRTPAEAMLNLPFELAANDEVVYRGKFLLFHGLNDSVYVWTDLAHALAQRGFDVRVVLLPGHGSHPKNMMQISYQEWLRAARVHHAFWDVDDTPMHLGGFSLGAVIATILALEHSDTAGMLLISPAYHSQLNSLLRWSWLYAYYKPWMFGGMILEDNPIKYNSIPINSGTQYFRTAQYLKGRWGKKKLAMPVLMVMTADDSVVDVDYARRLYRQKFTSQRNKLLLYSNDADVHVDAGQSRGKKEIIRPSNYPARRILNQSHLSLINAPDNPLFGARGSVLVCNGNEYPIFMACLRATGHWFGAQHTPSPDKTPVARTTYNPDFPYLLKLLEEVFL